MGEHEVVIVGAGARAYQQPRSASPALLTYPLGMKLLEVFFYARKADIQLFDAAQKRFTCGHLPTQT